MQTMPGSDKTTQSTFNSFCRVLYFFSMCEMLGIKVKQAWWADILDILYITVRVTNSLTAAVFMQYAQS